MAFQIEDGVLVRYTEESGVTEVVIPDGVTKIRNWTFSRCTSLTSITIPDGIAPRKSEILLRPAQELLQLSRYAGLRKWCGV